jgi:FMN phosphatase YigB (HAD superfamily)
MSIKAILFDIGGTILKQGERTPKRADLRRRTKCL